MKVMGEVPGVQRVSERREQAVEAAEWGEGWEMRRAAVPLVFSAARGG